ncbi:hypothetical protein [Streptomyces sp. NPDC020965]|uniref:hypothetical protein n=1 Tax=Streptomyces sp. NPDC020965 TaxID=3365105 RepID=UPI0037982E0F
MTVMTVSAPTLAAQQTALLTDLNAVLDRHPLAAAVTLLFTPETIALAPGEVLVQRVDTERGVIELHPRNVVDLAPGDVLHATQTMDPADDSFLDYAAAPTAGKYLRSTHEDGSESHIFVI